MAEGYRRIFWGIVVATFNITIGTLKILPAFVGGLMVMSGLSRFEEHFGKDEYVLIRRKTLILVVLSLGGAILTFAGYGEVGHQPLLLFMPLIVMIAELVVFHGILDLSGGLLLREGRAEEAETLIKKSRTYLILMGASLILIIGALTFGHGGVSFFAAILGIASRIYLLVTISYLRKTYEGSEDPKGDVARERIE